MEITGGKLILECRYLIIIQLKKIQPKKEGSSMSIFSK
jgi:hypothetical protein